MPGRTNVLVAATALVWCCSSFTSAGLAQTNPRSAPPPGPASRAPAPTPQAVAPAPAGTSNQPVAIPPPPTIDDPMLAPMPPAGKVITGWDEALTYVRARSTDLRTAVAQVTAAEGRSRVALAAALPQINGNVTFTHQLITNEGVQFSRNAAGGVTTTPIPIPNTDFFTGNIQLQQPIVALRQWYAVGTAHRAEDVARLGVEDTKRLIALNVAAAIVAVVTAERISELNRSGLRSSLERHDLTRRKQLLGAATGLDVIRAQQDVEVARATLVTGDESLRQSREALGLALGEPSQVGVDPGISLDGLERTAAGVCHPARSLEERADVARLRKNVEVGERGITDVKLGYLPTLGVNSTAATTTVNTGLAPNTTWNIQGVLSVPIWDGGARYGNMRVARATLEQAEQALIAQRRKAEIEVVQARRAVDVSAASRKVAADARALAAETDRLTRAGYIEGQGTSLELVIAAAALRQADITLALREFELVRARVLAVLALSTCTW